jgi:acyl-CoA synthetase (AMP-forming)/AMP-acid ligase II
MLYRADSFATGLLRLGYKKGDRFGIWMPNYEEWTIATMAAARLGVILVNLNPRCGHRREMFWAMTSTIS